MGPGIQFRLPADFPFATGHRVDRRHRCAERRVATVQQCQQLGIEVELADRDQIDDRQTDVLAQQIEAFGDKQLPALGPVLVGRADNLNGRYQPAIAFEVKDQDFVRILFRKFGIQGEGRRGGRLRRRCDADV